MAGVARVLLRFNATSRDRESRSLAVSIRSEHDPITGTLFTRISGNLPSPRVNSSAADYRRTVAIATGEEN